MCRDKQSFSGIDFLVLHTVCGVDACPLTNHIRSSATVMYSPGSAAPMCSELPRCNTSPGSLALQRSVSDGHVENTWELVM